MASKDNLIKESFLSLIDAAEGHAGPKKSKLRVVVFTNYNDISTNKNAANSIIRAIKTGVESVGHAAYEIPVFGAANKLALASNFNTIDQIVQKNIMDSIEIALASGDFDGAIFVPCGISAIKGMLQAGLAANMPSLFFGYGANEPAFYKGAPITENSIYEAAARVKMETIDEAELKAITRAYLPAFGEGEGMNNPNSLFVAYEAMGICLKGTATAPAGSVERLTLASKTGAAVTKLIDSQIVLKKLISRGALANAAAVNIATGGAVDTLKFLTETAKEIGYDFSLTSVKETAKITPQLVNLFPTDENNTGFSDFHRAGGVYAVLKRLLALNLVNAKALSYSGSTIEDEAGASGIYDDSVIRKVDNAHFKNNSTMVLSGNLCEKGALIRRGGLFKGLTAFSGYAVVFENEEDACRNLYNKKIKKGAVLVIKNQGQKGAPGTNTLSNVCAAVIAAGLQNDVLIISDGANSGLFNDMFVSNIEPETFSGETFALVQDDDVVELDFETGKLTLKVQSKDLNSRQRGWTPYKNPEPSLAAKFFKKK